MLQERYVFLGQRLPRAQFSPMLWQKLMFCYTQKIRYYHNLNHISYMFKVLGDHHITPVLGWSIFYHDIVYIPGAQDNELKSRLLAEQDLTYLGEHKEYIYQICTAIAKTKEHLDPSSAEEELLFDADYSILGSEPSVYICYAHNIRKEFQHLSDQDFYPARIEFLEHLLSKHSLFYTHDFKTKYQEKARKNITNEYKYITTELGFAHAAVV
jgi:predicted metal-dependent HD superfamily phosphohydrolase